MTKIESERERERGDVHRKRDRENNFRRNERGREHSEESVSRRLRYL